MPDLTERTRIARDLVTAWERQQEVYVAHRETRFTVMLDVVAAVVDSPAPRVLDLACGPGSLAGRVLDRFPAADVVAVDLDPLLLELGRLDQAGRERRPVWVQADLRDPGWVEALPHARFDAVVSTTALHWLGGDDLAAVYRAARGLLRPGGVLLNGDYLPARRPWGPLAELAHRLGRSREQEAVAAGAVDWDGWWERVRATPALADEVAAHDAVLGDRVAGQAPSLEFHLAALREAGFAEADLIWHDLTEGLVCALA